MPDSANIHEADRDYWRQQFVELTEDYHKLYAENERMITRACRAESISNAVRDLLEPQADQVNPSLLVIREVLFLLRRCQAPAASVGE